MTVVHSTFTIEQTFTAAPATVFAAFSSRARKDPWFIDTDGFVVDERALDFKVGGEELMRGRFVGGAHDGAVVELRGRYHAIVPDALIVFAYDMRGGGTLGAITLCTIELAAHGSGTHLIITEATAFLDGVDDTEGRRGGAIAQRDRLKGLLDGAASS